MQQTSGAAGRLGPNWTDEDVKNCFSVDKPARSIRSREQTTAAMSSESELESPDVQRESRGSTAAQRITNLSDDDSDAGDRGGAISRGGVSHASLSSPDEAEDAEVAEEEHEETAVYLDAHERRVVRRKHSDTPVDILHFPPTVTVPSSIVTRNTRIDTAQTPVAYRLSRSAKGTSPANIIYNALHKGEAALGDVLESNTNLVTWPDGSRTLMVGDEQFVIVSDPLVSDYFIFRKGEDVQTFNAKVKAVGRVQPTSVGIRSQMALSNSTSMLSSAKRREPRKVMRTMKEGGEHEERLAKEASFKRERERTKLEARKRLSMDRHMIRSRGLTTAALESEPEASDEEAERVAEHNAQRLMKIKRPQPGGHADLPFKRRKAGGRKVLGLDDDDEEEEDEDEEHDD